jgi:hypothetical protein
LEVGRYPRGIFGFRSFRLLSVCYVLSVITAITASIAFGSIRHSVFGLNPRVTYDVRVGGDVLLADVSPGPNGDISFDAPTCDPVRIVPRNQPHLAGVRTPATPRLEISLPAPNPTSGSFELRLRSDRQRQIRIQLVEVSAGRIVHEHLVALPSGESVVAVAVPDRVASGLILVRIEDGLDVAVRKLLLLRRCGAPEKR